MSTEFSSFVISHCILGINNYGHFEILFGPIDITCAEFQTCTLR